MKKITLEEAIKRLKEINPKLSIVPETYTVSSKKCLMVEEGYGEFWVKPREIFQGKQKGHPAAARKKQKQTCLEKYGSESYLWSKEGKEKIKKILEEKYPGGHQMRDPEVMKKWKSANIKKYGCENPMQNKLVREKTEQTNIERYGDICPLKNPKIKEKQRLTNIERYGGNSSMHSQEVFLKNLRSGRDVTSKTHWKTKEEILCRGSYESKVVDFLNKNQIDYEWQIRFKLPSGKIYICDLYIINDNKYVEIKGYWRNDAMEKWIEFQSISKNSEVWDKPKLKALGII